LLLVQKISDYTRDTLLSKYR